MKKVLIMDATRSECIEAIRKDKMKKSVYGSGYPMYECGSDMGYYVQIQVPGSSETTLIEGSKPSTKISSGAWGRVWYKGSYLKQFSGPLNVVRQEIIKYLQQLTTDSHPLKTYKIKNHDSGKTYSVKAVNYTDAKIKYNKYILKDANNSIRKELETKAMKLDLTLLIKEFEAQSRTEGPRHYNRAMETLFSMPKDKQKQFIVSELWDTRLKRLTKDSLTEDALSKFVQSYLSTKRVSSKAEQDEIIKFLLERNKITTEDIPKVRALLKIVKDSLTEDADIAQNDIKSTYLPEDANADNIQYLGFNEKRKLSFYSYGDRYFVHYDLEGRTEEIDKETVQKILKKNILGEIDENDLINKEPQAEEIVSDTFKEDASILAADKEKFKSKIRDILKDMSKDKKWKSVYGANNIIENYVWNTLKKNGELTTFPSNLYAIIRDVMRESNIRSMFTDTFESDAGEISIDLTTTQERGDR